MTVPVGACAIRRGATVMGVRGNQLGVVSGFVVDDAEILAIVVRSGALGHGRDVLVAFDVVVGQPGDVVFLSISIDEFGLLPETDLVPRGAEFAHFIHHQHDHATSAAIVVADRVRGVLERVLGRDRDR